MGVRIERFMFESFQPANAMNESALSEVDAPALSEGAAVEEVAAAPAITPEELTAARDASYQEGFAAGTTAGKEEVTSQQAEIERQICDMLPTVVTTLTEASARHQAFLEEQKHSMSQLVLAIAKKVAGEAIKEDPLAEIEALVSECLTTLVEEPTVTVYIHPDLTNSLKQRAEEALAATPSLSVTLSVEADAAIAHGDCRVEWKNGSAERNTATLWDNISLIINQRFAQSEPPQAAAPAATEDTLADITPVAMDEPALASPPPSIATNE